MTKAQTRCSRCNQTGHNKRTCGMQKVTNREPETHLKPRKLYDNFSPTHPPTSPTPSTAQSKSLSDAFNKMKAVKVSGDEQVRSSRADFEEEMVKVNKTYEDVVLPKVYAGEEYTPEELEVLWELRRENTGANTDPYASPYNQNGQVKSEEDETAEQLHTFLTTIDSTVNSQSVANFLKTFDMEVLVRVPLKPIPPPHALKALVLTADDDHVFPESQTKTLMSQKGVPIEAMVIKRDTSNAKERVIAVSHSRMKGKNVDFFAADTHPAVRVYVAKKSNNVKILTHYALNETNAYVAAEALSNPKTPPAVLSEFFTTRLSHTPPGNRSAPPSQKGTIGVLKSERSHYEDTYILKLMENPNTPRTVKENIIEGLRNEPDSEPLKLLYCTPKR